MIYKFKIYFSEKKISYIENLRIKSLIYFRQHHINTLSDFVLRRFHVLVISLISEWNTKILQYFLAKSQHPVRSIFLIKSSAWNLWFYTNTLHVFLIKLQALALATQITCINYITKYINSILIQLFWYYLLAPVSNFWKQTHLEKYVSVPLEKNLLYQMHTANADFCLLRLNLKLSMTTCN